MNSSPNYGRRSSYQSAALRSSACASGCSSRCTSLFEFLQDLGARSVPAGRLNATFSDVSRTPFQFGRPCRGDFLVRLFQTGKQFLRDPGAVDACQAQRLGEQLVRRHDGILAPALSRTVSDLVVAQRESVGSRARTRPAASDRPASVTLFSGVMGDT